MRKFLFALVALVALLATTPASNQAIDINTLIANESGNFTWATTAPTSAPSGSSSLVNWARYKTIVAYTTASPCPYATATGSLVVNWNAVIACASTHTPSLQTQSVSASYQAGFYSAMYDIHSGVWTCGSVTGNTGYSGTPIYLPAGTVAPTTTGTELSISLTSITLASGVSATISLLNPSGATKLGPTGLSSGGTYSNTYYATGAPAGAWEWTITYTGGTPPSCNSSTGPSGGGFYFTASGSVGWYQ